VRQTSAQPSRAGESIPQEDPSAGGAALNLSSSFDGTALETFCKNGAGETRVPEAAPHSGSRPVSWAVKNPLRQNYADSF
jgi:hypothetical protein